MGAEVTVLSQSLRKRDDGLRLGADAYFATSDPETSTQLGSRFDLIINTVSAQVDVNALLGLLATDGALVNVGAPAEPLPVGVFSLLTQRRSFAGSAIGSIARPRRYSTSAPSTASVPRSRSSAPARPTTPGSACSAPTCATASSSTPRRSRPERAGDR